MYDDEDDEVVLVNLPARQFSEDKVIPVLIGGKPYETGLDDRGVQRFRDNKVIDFILQRAGDYILNEIAIENARRPFSTEDLLDFYTQTGYSVSGMLDLNYFEDLTAENPLWDNESEDQTEL